MFRIAILLISVLISSSGYVKAYFPLDNNLDYRLIEYAILKSKRTDFFVLNQPYSNSQVFNLLNETELINQDFINRYKYLEDNNINFKNDLGLINVDYDENNPFKVYLDFDININLGDFTLVNSIDMDKTLKDDDDYHGDVKEWASAYIKNSYVLYKYNNIEIFGGRTSRNLGILNDYSLAFSNNPYPFDHFGLSLEKNKIKFSFYFTRLNNIKKGQDIQGVVIPFEYDDNGNVIMPEVETKRYFSIQRLDFKISDNFQASLSGSIIYGGPNQSFVADFLNPLNLYYLSQRNNKIQMNNLYQLNLFYRFNNEMAVYLDFLIDDIIVNNEPGVTDLHDNRFGLMLKLSSADFLGNKNLFSIRYAKIWNETYLSYRNFENYIFFNKGIGFPYNGFEGLKFSLSSFKHSFLLNRSSLEFYRKGDNELSDIFNDTPLPFPAGEIEYGLYVDINVLYFSDKNIEFSYLYAYNRYVDELADLFKNFDSHTTHKIKLIYKFQY